MKTSNFRIWLLFFVTTAVMALIVQLLILPVIFPALHAGHGLVVGGDWIGFHQIAQELAEKTSPRAKNNMEKLFFMILKPSFVEN